MVEKATPRTLIQGFLDTANTNQGVIQPRRRGPIPKTPKVLPSTLNKTLIGGQRVSSTKKRRQTYHDEFTRYLIESNVATNKMDIPAQQHKKRRRSSIAAPPLFDPIADNYTPKTNIMGFLQQAPEETPVGRQLKRRSSNLPEIPSNKSIHISHDFSSNIEDENELTVDSGRRKSKGRGLTNRTTVKQFSQGVQQITGQVANSDEVIEKTPRRKSIQEIRDLPEIPSNKSINIEFSDIEEDSGPIHTPSKRKSEGRALYNRIDVQQFSQGIHHLSQKDPNTSQVKDISSQGEEDEDNEDGTMADIDSDSESTGSGVSGFSPRKLPRLSSQLPDKSRRSSLRSQTLNKTVTNTAAVSDTEMSPVIANKSSVALSETRKTLRRSTIDEMQQTLENTVNSVKEMMSNNLNNDITSPSVTDKSGTIVNKSSDDSSRSKLGYNTRKSLIDELNHNSSPGKMLSHSVSAETPMKTIENSLSPSVSDGSPNKMSTSRQSKSDQTSTIGSVTNMSPRNTNMSPGNNNTSPRNNTSPGNTNMSPRSTNMSPGNTNMSPENNMSPRNNSMLPGNTNNTNMSHGNTNMSPGNTVMSPGNSNMSSGNTNTGITKKGLSPRTTTPENSPRHLTGRITNEQLDSPVGSVGKSLSNLVQEEQSRRLNLGLSLHSPGKSPRQSPSTKSPHVMEKSKRTVTEVLMDRSRRNSVAGMSPLASKVMRKSIHNMSSVINNNSLGQSSTEFSPKLSSTRKYIELNKSSKKSLSEFSPKLSSTRKSLGAENYVSSPLDVNKSSVTGRFSGDSSAAGDCVPEEELSDDEEEEYEEDTTSMENTSNKYKLKTPHLHPHQDRPSPQLSDRRIPLKESSVNRASPTDRVKKIAGKAQRTKNAAKLSMPISVTKKIFTHFCKMKVAKDAIPEIVKVSERFWQQIASDIESYAQHAGRKTIDESDVELLMKRQRFITEKKSLNGIVEKHLPLELRQEIIPMARSGNKVTPL